jgi:hypothetical protein
LRRAWTEIIRFRLQWQPLFEYCHEIGLRDSNLNRQQNYCLDILASYWHLEGQRTKSGVRKHANGCQASLAAAITGTRCILVAEELPYTARRCTA